MIQSEKRDNIICAWGIKFPLSDIIVTPASTIFFIIIYNSYCWPSAVSVYQM